MSLNLQAVIAFCLLKVTVSKQESCSKSASLTSLTFFPRNCWRMPSFAVSTVSFLVSCSRKSNFAKRRVAQMSYRWIAQQFKQRPLCEQSGSTVPWQSMHTFFVEISNTAMISALFSSPPSSSQRRCEAVDLCQSVANEGSVVTE